MTASICVATNNLTRFCPLAYVLGDFLHDIFICCLAYRMNDSSLWPINLHNYLHGLHRSQRHVRHRFAWSRAVVHYVRRVCTDEWSLKYDRSPIYINLPSLWYSQDDAVHVSSHYLMGFLPCRGKHCFKIEHICLMLYAVKHIEGIIKVEDLLLFS